MTRPMFQHLKQIKAIGGKLTQQQFACYALACCERQLPVYAKAAAGQSWNGYEILRKSLDFAWEWVANDYSIAERDAECCEECAPPETFDGATSVAADIAFSVGSVMRFIVTNNANYAIGVGETSFNLIDALIYAITGLEINSENDLIVDEHELMCFELSCQQNDVIDIQRISENGDLVSILRPRYFNVSIANNYWFPEGY